ncbi:hypothetical protein [uncultured Flavonifractor sp.]|uniref:hypothetical protein n=1 Tax=uncultured Flavonifractor sp. TaxID=1193534 RepID=UPI0026029A77|nr:hypothetical protein [uncultured Flavonifractor sp.]
MKRFNITVQGKPYDIRLRAYSVEINGTRYKLRSLPTRKVIFLTMEIDLPIEGASVMLVPGLVSMELVVDGVYVRSGKPYTPIGKVPVWGYVLSALNLVQVINGAIGVLLGFLGIYLTLRISTAEDIAPPVRILLSVAYLVLSWVAIILIAALLVIGGGYPTYY